MSQNFDATPDVPPELENAAKSGELVVFVGAGISRLVNCPSWDGFADKVLDELTPEGIDYHELSQIKSIKNPKKRLSIARIIADNKQIKIDYKKIFSGSPDASRIYDHLNSFNSSFVTTNYEKFLRPTSREAHSEPLWRFYRKDQFLRTHLDENGSVIHLHGCIDDPASMIITMRDYLEHYASPEVEDFLQDLFRRKVVLFLGYGLDEIEVLEYILRRGGANKEPANRTTRFMLQGFFDAEISLFKMLKQFYVESFGTDLIGFPKDQRNYAQQTDILQFWASRLRFGNLELADEAAAIRAEISG